MCEIDIYVRDSASEPRTRRRDAASSSSEGALGSPTFFGAQAALVPAASTTFFVAVLRNLQKSSLPLSESRAPCRARCRRFVPNSQSRTRDEFEEQEKELEIHVVAAEEETNFCSIPKSSLRPEHRRWHSSSPLTRTARRNKFRCC